MVFEKLIIKNYRQYKDIEFNFNDDINIIEAENGIGKSTFMSTIIFALYGIEQVRKSGLIEDMTYMANQGNVEVSSAKTSYNFRENDTEVTLILKVNESGKRFEIKRTLNNRRYLAETKMKDVGMYKTSNFEKVKVYEISDVSKPEVDISRITSIIPENIAPLLFFDGERINSIESVINVGRKSDEFQKEVERILDLEVYEDANRLINKSVKDIKVSLTSTSNDTELAIRQRECNELEREMKEKIETKDKTINKLADQELETKEYEEILKANKHSIDLQEKREALKAQIKEARNTENVYKDQLLAMIWEVGPSLSTSSVFKSLNEVLSTGKSIYEISGMEQRAVDDILVKNTCICGTRLSSNMRETLEDFKETLPPESFESMLKSEIADAVDIDDKDKEYTNLRIDFGKTKSRITSLEKDVQQISKQIQEIGEDDIRAVEMKHAKSIDLETKFTSEISSLDGEIKSISNRLEQNQKFVDEKLNIGKANYIDKQARKILEETEVYLRGEIKLKKERIKEVLEKKVNENIKLLMRDSARITLKSNLTPQVTFTGGATSASSGQNVMISLAYLLGLMQIAKLKTGDIVIARKTSYPIVMDGVTAKLDINHTHSMVENILKANTQVIFLANDQMLIQLQASILKLSGLNSIDDKLTTLRRDKNTNETYKVGEK